MYPLPADTNVGMQPTDADVASWERIKARQVNAEAAAAAKRKGNFAVVAKQAAAAAAAKRNGNTAAGGGP